MLLILAVVLFSGCYASFPHRNLTWNDINFVHTTDTHGWYSGHINQPLYHANWGDFISFTTHLRRIAHSQNQDLLLIDSGDRHDGNGLSDITSPNGLKSTPIFIKQDYDLLTIGNHELYLWENSKQEYETVVNHFQDKYVCSNVDIRLDNGSFVPLGSKYKYFTTPIRGIRVLAFGFLFDFKRFNSGTRVTPMAETIHEPWFQEALKHEVDLIIIVGHTPISHNWGEFYQVHQYLRQFFPDTIIQYFGGHSHIRDFTVFDSLSTGLQSGRYCETVGWTSVNLDKADLNLPVRQRFSRSYIDFNTDSFKYHTNLDKEFDTAKGKSVSKLIRETRKELKLDTLIGYVKTNYYVDYVPIDHPKSIFNLLASKILKTLPKSKHEERITIINTGSIRYDLYKGPYTIDSKFIVSPFENIWVNITVPKSVATKVAAKLNDADYISASRLKPPHQYDLQVQDLSTSPHQAHFEMQEKLPKGYVTHDDFGADGDDTLHRAVVNFPVPNVIQSVEINDEVDSPVNLVFYSFITPNIIWALKELNFSTEQVPTPYSDIYLGTLLNEFVANNKI
ncbi:hypothetical protein MG7_02461 [Candida albicans P34048]|uniref:Uncharacterized protein n=1 Tax=Candida albicans (strain WO-1) TaxID=294748 RepID=C4YKW6_CANAW|nr:conserved hypothetical protein [Candida albicans WO-1]KGU27804.1 hypothetical protein MG7_02461 [Candida albicans P34048]KGU34123.1 hypothetical protein MGK_02442 [Candida albicans P57055]